MPSNLLFALNNEGHIFGLTLNGTKWRKFQYVGLEFKQLSAVPSFLWAVGGDRQIYVHVHGLDCPIRVKEEAYENERWFPFQGFKKKLLPTDRYPYSDISGVVDRNLEEIRLPSMAWQWEGGWKVERTLDGKPLDDDGWSYAFDFSYTYYPTMHYNAYVRRRKLVRYRRYMALNSWCAIAPLHKDPTQEPFIGVSVGGTKMAGVDRETMLVWAVTASGRLFFRTEVSNTLPEGRRWTYVPVPNEYGVSQVSVSSTGIVWVVLLNGKALVRTGITRHCLLGTDWSEVSEPRLCSGTLPLTQVSIGSYGLWAITRDSRVWFRNGILEYGSLSIIINPKGTSWVEIHGKMASISVASDDQVWAVGAENRRIYFRTSITKKNLKGQTWRAITAPAQLTKKSSSITLKNGEVKSNLEVKRQKSLESLHSGSHESKTYENVSHPVFGKEVAVPISSWSPQHAGGTVVATEAHYAADSTIFESHELPNVYSEHGEQEDEDDYLYQTDTKAFWLSVEAGAFLLKSSFLPNWFKEENTNKNNNKKKAESVDCWRVKILNQLRNRLSVNVEELKNYEKAIDISTWTKAEKCKCLLPGEMEYRDCTIETDCLSLETDNLVSSTLTISRDNKSEVWTQINLREVRAVMNCSILSKPRVALHYNSIAPLKLQFRGENAFEEWKSELASICCRLRNPMNTLSSDSVWVTTTLGDVYVCDLSQIKAEQQISNNEMYSTEMTFVGFDMPIEIPLRAGFWPGSFVTISVGVQERADSFYINLICREENGNDNIAFHFNPRLRKDVVVLNTRKGALWGSEETIQYHPFFCGTLFEVKIICENDCFTVLVDGSKYKSFTIKRDQNSFEISPSFITHLKCGGDITISKIQYSARHCIIEPSLLFWTQIDGHFKKVETAGEITWGIGFDGTPWVYLGPDTSVTQRMQDVRNCYVYENQRWNPLTGFTSHGLPTDRFMWSDVTGKHKRVLDKTVLPSKKWHWDNAWSIDFDTPGGVDPDGWQYAMDFPSSYHGSRNFTDCVRRRRWFRRAKLKTEGPWMELGYTLLSDCSLCTFGGTVLAWGVAANGYVLFRRGVSKSRPSGLSWEHVPSDEQIINISCSPKQVWAVGKSGVAFCRLGISSTNPIGDVWESVEAPQGTSLKKITVGDSGVWALDSSGRISLRQEVSSAFPLGSHWETLSQLSPELDSNEDCDFFESPVTESTGGWRHIVSKSNLWALTSSGRLAFRMGINAENPTGSSWLFGIPANFLHISST